MIPEDVTKLKSSSIRRKPSGVSVTWSGGQLVGTDEGLLQWHLPDGTQQHQTRAHVGPVTALELIRDATRRRMDAALREGLTE
jgi:hypothetical protein